MTKEQQAALEIVDRAVEDIERVLGPMEITIETRKIYGDLAPHCVVRIQDVFSLTSQNVKHANKNGKRPKPIVLESVKPVKKDDQKSSEQKAKRAFAKVAMRVLDDGGFVLKKTDEGYESYQKTDQGLLTKAPNPFQ